MRRWRSIATIAVCWTVALTGCRTFRWPDGTIPFEGRWPQLGMFAPWSRDAPRT